MLQCSAFYLICNKILKRKLKTSLKSTKEEDPTTLDTDIAVGAHSTETQNSNGIYARHNVIPDAGIRPICHNCGPKYLIAIHKTTFVLNLRSII